MRTHTILPLLACVALATLATTANADCLPGCMDECNAFVGDEGMNPAMFGTDCEGHCDHFCNIISQGGDCQEDYCMPECRSFADDTAEKVGMEADYSHCEDHCNHLCGMDMS